MDKPENGDVRKLPPSAPCPDCERDLTPEVELSLLLNAPLGTNPNGVDTIRCPDCGKHSEIEALKAILKKLGVVLSTRSYTYRLDN